MVAWYSKSIIRSSSVSFFHWHPLTSLLDAEIEIGCCLQWVLSEVSQVSVSEMPEMKLIVRSSSRKHPIPGLPSWGYPGLSLQECPSGCMLQSPPATNMRAYCLSSGIWSATKITFIRRLKSFHVATLSAALQSISGYFSLGTDGMIVCN